VFDQHLRTYLFTESPITEVEAEAEAADVLSSDAEPEAMARPLDGSLGIGSLKGRS
jgi:hypothetical protein